MPANDSLLVLDIQFFAMENATHSVRAQNEGEEKKCLGKVNKGSKIYSFKKQKTDGGWTCGAECGCGVSKGQGRFFLKENIATTYR